MKLPRITLPDPPPFGPTILMPSAWFPEMMLRAAAVVPPIVLPNELGFVVPAEKAMKMPSPPLPRAVVPVTSVPIKLPCTIVRVVPESWSTIP